MDYETLNEQKGFHVVSGYRRLQAALSIGHPVLAYDSDGKVFRIAMEGDQVTVVAAEGEHTESSMVIVARTNSGKPI